MVTINSHATQQTPQPVKRTRTTHTTPRKVAIRAMLDSGVPPKTIAEQLGCSDTYVYDIAKTGKKNCFEELKPQALKSLEKLIRGEPVGTAETVKCSTILAASREVLDRTDPKVSIAVTEDHQFFHFPDTLNQPTAIDVTPNANDIRELESKPDVIEGVKPLPGHIDK